MSVMNQVMNKGKAAVFMIVCASALAACTSGSKKVQVLPTGDIKPGSGSGDAVVVAGAGEVPITLQRDVLAKYGDTANMNYKFSYLGVNKAEKLSFDATGASHILVQNLPAGRAGSVSLEIYEGSTLKLKGTVDNLTLTAGQNNKIGLQLVQADGAGGNGNPGSNGTNTDLTIDVSLDNGGGVVIPPSNGGGTGGSTGGPITNPADPLAGWDGKSFLGNAKWTIVPVNG